jgi:hypothetical protein
MILTSLEVDVAAFEVRTGWALKPQGACKGEMCVPLPKADRTISARQLSERLGMPLVHDAKHVLWALGPETLGRALVSADAPEFTLADHRTGDPFTLSSLRGQKVFLLAWASW